MAITLNGKRIGQAAKLEAEDFRDYLDAAQEKERKAREAHIAEVCQRIRDIIGDQAEYNAWWASTSNSRFTQEAEDKLAQLLNGDPAAECPHEKTTQGGWGMVRCTKCGARFLPRNNMEQYRALSDVLSYSKNQSDDNHWYSDNPNY